MGSRCAEDSGGGDLNLTPLRLRALAIISASPGCLAQHLAFELVKRRWSNQGATRWGAAYVKPLWRAGLVDLHVRDVTCGFAECRLTPDGQRARDGLPMASSDHARRTSGSCICSTCNREYRRHALGGPLGINNEPFLNRLCNGDLVKL